MATFANIQKKIAVKIKTLTLAEKEKERILSRGKENELTKQQEFIEKRLGEIKDLKNQGHDIPIDEIESKLRSFKKMEE